jgi:DNA-packaging protein gp3
MPTGLVPHGPGTVGRPSFYTTSEQLQTAIDGYFDKCDSHKSMVLNKDKELVEISDPIYYTIADLARHLGFAQRNDVARYAADYPEFAPIINDARLRIEGQRSRDLVDPMTRNANGLKFDLVNNHGWQDEQRFEIQTGLDKFMTELASIVLEYVPDSRREECSSRLRIAINR